MRNRDSGMVVRLAPFSFMLLLLLVLLILRPAWESRDPAGPIAPARPLVAPGQGVVALPAPAADVPLPYSSAPDYLDAGLQAILDNVLNGAPGNWAIAVKKLDTGQYAAVNAHTQTVAASLYKLFVFYEVMHQRMLGHISLGDGVTITAGDAAYDQSIGDLNWIIGDQVTVANLVDRMITVSDNTAAVALTYEVGVDNINDSLRRLGLADSSLNFSGGDNITSASDYAHLLELIATGQVLDRDSCHYMLGVLLRQQLNDWLPQGLPGGTPFAHKTGTLDNIGHDAGIVYGPSGPFVITVLSWNQDDYASINNLMPIISQQVYRYFNGRPYQPARYFSQTAEVVGPSFLLFYNTNGGPPIFGLPIAPEVIQGTRAFQYFERARLERPAAGGTVSLGMIGRDLTAARNQHFDPTTPADPGDPNTQWFAATQQAIGQPFLTYWREHGGQAIFGLPISNIVFEQRGGQKIRVQYFERARFELQGDTIQLGLLGRDLAARLK